MLNSQSAAWFWCCRWYAESEAGHKLECYQQASGVPRRARKTAAKASGVRPGRSTATDIAIRLCCNCANLHALLVARPRRLLAEQFEPVVADLVGNGHAVFGRHAETARRSGGKVNDKLGAGQLREECDGVGRHLLRVATGRDEFCHVEMKLPQIERLRGRPSLVPHSDGEVAGIGVLASSFHDARPLS